MMPTKVLLSQLTLFATCPLVISVTLAQHRSAEDQLRKSAHEFLLMPPGGGQHPGINGKEDNFIKIGNYSGLTITSIDLEIDTATD